MACAILVLGTNAAAQKSADEELPVHKANKATSILEHLDYIKGFFHDSREAKKADAAVTAERAKLSGAETKTLEVVTKDGPLWAGGTFVRVQEAKPGPKVAEKGEVYTKPFEVSNQIASASTKDLTIAQKKEMKERAEAMLRQEKHEKLVKEAQAAEKKMLEVRDAAEKARKELEDKQRAANDARVAAQKAEEQRAAAVKAQAQAAEAQAAAAQAQAAATKARAAAESRRVAAEKAERDAVRDGQRMRDQLNEAKTRYKKEGGPYRMPAGGA